MRRVAVIGAGLAGLECGYILARNGLDVIVLEQGAAIGGCLRTFRRKGTVFDTGFHYVGGLDEGQSLHGLFRYLDLLDLPWQRLDPACFDEVVFGDESYAFANGHDTFVETLAQSFPHEREGLRCFADMLRQTGDHLMDVFTAPEGVSFAQTMLGRSAYEFLCQTIRDPRLRQVLSATSLKMELDSLSLPLYVFAQINNSYIQSAWRLCGGGQQIADRLADRIRAFGGQVRTCADVTAIREKDGQVTGVVVNGEEEIAADGVIATLHPYRVVRLLGDAPPVRKVYRRRMADLANSQGMFTANIRLRPDTAAYLNRNIYVHRADADLWHPRTRAVQSVFVSFYPGQAAADLLTPVSWEELAPWTGEPGGRMSGAYREYKERKAEECLSLLERRLPQLRGSIEDIYTSTPLTYRRYTRACEGSAFGIKKDCRSPLTTVLSPLTPVGNLLLSGQHLNLHGVLGVSMTAMMTCAAVLGKETLVRQCENPLL